MFTRTVLRLWIVLKHGMLAFSNAVCFRLAYIIIFLNFDMEVMYTCVYFANFKSIHHLYMASLLELDAFNTRMHDCALQSEKMLSEKRQKQITDEIITADFGDISYELIDHTSDSQ